MSVMGTARRTVTRVADATTAAAGAVGGAAVTGVIGAVEGAAAGMKNGLSEGSRSTVFAGLTLAAIGAAGLVEWPVLLVVGGGALAVHELSRRAARAEVGDNGKPSARKTAGDKRQSAGGRSAKP